MIKLFHHLSNTENETLIHISDNPVKQSENFTLEFSIFKINSTYVLNIDFIKN